jgi:hypothetical protein
MHGYLIHVFAFHHNADRDAESKQINNMFFIVRPSVICRSNKARDDLSQVLYDPCQVSRQGTRVYAITWEYVEGKISWIKSRWG